MALIMVPLEEEKMATSEKGVEVKNTKELGWLHLTKNNEKLF